MKRWVFALTFIMTIGVVWYFTGQNQENSSNFAKYNYRSEKPDNKKEVTQQRVPANNFEAKRETANVKPIQVIDKPVKNPDKLKSSYLKIKSQNFQVSNRAADKFIGRNGNYGRIKNLIAIAKSDYTEGPFKKIGEFNGYYLIETTEEVSDLTNGLVVLKNQSSGGAAIFTGILKVKFNDYSDAPDLRNILSEKFGKNYDFTLVEEQPHIRLGFFKFNSYEETMAVHKLLISTQMNTVIQRSTIDLIEWRRTN